MSRKHRKQTVMMALGAFTLGLWLLGSAHAYGDMYIRAPAYHSSIKVQRQHHGERGEAARLVALTKIDATQAAASALTQVPGKVLKVALDNENGNLVYSVEIKTANNEIKDVKVDAGNGTVLYVDTGGDEHDEED